MQRRHSHRISSFTKLRERPIRNDKQLRAIVRVGQSVNFAVERFASVGESIADDNPEIRNEMYDACKDARTAGALIEQLCSLTAPSLRGGGGGGSGTINDPNIDNVVDQVYNQHDTTTTTSTTNSVEETTRQYADRQAMARAARALLSSVTRVLLVADTVVVKQIVASKDRVSMSLNRLENVANFTEFVKAFSHFGMEMVELAHLTSDRKNDLKNEKRRAQMSAARKTLERSTMMLLTTSKVCLRHPDCQTARENRDTVFAQMRRAMDLIHFVVKEGIVTYQSKSSSTSIAIAAATAAAAASHAAATAATYGSSSSSSPHPYHRPTSSSSNATTVTSSSTALHLPFDPHNEALLYGYDYLQQRAQQQQQQQRCSSRDMFSIPKYQRRGQLHRVQRTIPGNSFVLAVESTLRWLHEQLDACPTIVNFLQRICELSDLAQMGQMTSHVKEQIMFALDAAIERTQDFTDSAYTNHDHREQILLLCDQLRAEVEAFFRAVVCFEFNNQDDSPCFQTSTVIGDEFEQYILQITNISNELKNKLQNVSLEQADELFRHHTSSIDLPVLLKGSAIDCDHEQIDELIEQFREHSDHVQEVCRLLFHISPTSSLQVTAGHTETSIEIHGEQLLTALHTLILYPNSKIVKENYEVFADVWSSLVGDISQIMRDISDYFHEQHERELLNRPPVPAQPPPPPIPHVPPSATQQQQQQQQSSPLSMGRLVPPGATRSILSSPSLATAPISMKGNVQSYGYLEPGKEPILMTGDTPGTDMYGVAAMPGAAAAIPDIEDPSVVSGAAAAATSRPTNVQINPEVEVYEIEKSSAPSVDLDDNDIVRKAKAMSSMAMSMFQFTRGEGELKTTQDLFTQAEFFAEEANKLYKIVRHFTYQIPTGAPKKELLDCIDQVPTYVQQLQFAVKNVTVGKTATFTKVDNVIQETKNLMSVITNVVSASLNCANKHNLDMQGALRTRARTLSPSYRQDTEMFFEGGAMSKGGVASSDPDI
ncbi:alpha-catenin related isoform X2 [Dermatophagoides pteronyssinus]|uniref:Alpha-catulin-like isoform X2 n=2 Tax=Dermatophagoides pteronyssinus TaxID=6956 RepID=A0A6P6Y4Q7_DERPT|nr:alpha-catulin-like isoform X2 [Dermatophagoides pteronyssinus]KAH9419799.1 Alpha-catulin [Dermatophagoides pteronyssinus]